MNDEKGKNSRNLRGCGAGRVHAGRLRECSAGRNQGTGKRTVRGRDIFETAAEQEDGEKSAEAYRGLGMAYYDMEEYGSAMEAFQTALDRGAGQTVQIYNLMGICAMNVADYESALEYFQSGLALADTESEGETDTDLIREMRYNEIVCCERTADWESAKQKAAEYLQDYPGDEAVEKEAEFLETR